MGTAETWSWTLAKEIISDKVGMSCIMREFSEIQNYYSFQKSPVMTANIRHKRGWREQFLNCLCCRQEAEY